ncbi:MAG TPA: UvrD-helicase domain-containing protein, partial [Rhodanobacter sp.]|nr:UvrD-helicase domain-containing protein [Rhodanobacter sp.]
MLNPQQQAAVEHCDTPLLVLAGAGSGKTSVITQKIAHLIQRRRLAAGRIAAITFTNKAAREMRERVGKLVSSDDAAALTVCTFHALGLKFLQIEHARADLRRGFSVFDAGDSEGILKELSPKGAKPDVLAGIRHLVSAAKSAGLSPAEALAAARSPKEIEAATIYELYQARLAAFNAVDFDDLIRLPLRILETDTECRDAWRERLRYLLVDEYQDTNDAQYRLLKVL